MLSCFSKLDDRGGFEHELVDAITQLSWQHEETTSALDLLPLSRFDDSVSLSLLPVGLRDRCPEDRHV